MDYFVGSVQGFAALFEQAMTVLNSFAYVGNIGFNLLGQLSRLSKVLKDLVVHNPTLYP
jgi:hypothetical protein